jgi:hypothetical protein
MPPSWHVNLAKQANHYLGGDVMSIMELGALGEFVGSILVLVTLVYLAVQIRQGIAHARFTNEFGPNRSAFEMPPFLGHLGC